MSCNIDHRLNRFRTDDRGNVAMMFGLMAIAMFLVMGGAIDFGRWNHARQQSRSAMDAAVLAAAKQLQLDNTDVDGAVAVAQRFYNENVKTRMPLLTDTVSFESTKSNMAIRANGEAWIETTFLKLAGIEKLRVLDLTGADSSVAEISTGANNGQNLEVAMMLDITGSMAGDKLSDMKTAAKDLVDIVVWDNQSEYTSKVSLVPFSQAVNVGATYFKAITNQNTNSTLSSIDPAKTFAPEAPSLTSRMLAAARSLAGFISPAHAGKKGKISLGGGNGNGFNSGGSNGNGNSGGGGGGTSGGDDDGNSGGGSSQNYDPCVVERDGSNVFTDAAPGSGNYFDVYDVAKQNNWSTKDSECKPTNVTIMPLSNDKTALKAKIDTFVASGYTAGHIGTAFAWYTISPNWDGIWPASSKPAPYDDANTKKIAVLMTDGVYNTSYNGSSAGTASEQAVSICTNMKAKGVEVYTVGFQLGGNQTAINTLASCATDADHAYNAEEGSELQQAFRDIALKISHLRLTQ
jgi:Flp pilus assembly protein TadG